MGNAVLSSESRGENQVKEVSNFQVDLFRQTLSNAKECNVETITKTLETWHNNDLLIHTGRQKKDEKPPQATMSKAARALAVLHDHPDWTNKQIADAIGANEKSLPRMKGFSKAREILKTGKSDYPSGSKYPDSETGQDNLESWDNQ